ncbi:MAG TPA: YsaB family lipoprotein [Enterobacteriaceae bacterium]|nr:YsaB family lipoprotein [Enterobacteriaceae bacterium]
MIIKYFPPLILAMALVGCATSPQPEQRAQKAQVSVSRTLDMEQLCRAEAGRRYNTASEKLTVTGLEQFQASYEMRGYTSRKEGFVCSFDPEGQFLHLSMR